MELIDVTIIDVDHGRYRQGKAKVSSMKAANFGWLGTVDATMQATSHAGAKSLTKVS